MSPQAIREEVEVLKADFNNRMKQVIFSSVLNAYFAGFLPCCFAQVIIVKLRSYPTVVPNIIYTICKNLGLAIVNLEVLLKDGVFWDVMLCGSCKNRRFGRT
jgi:hypothetical protein